MKVILEYNEGTGEVKSTYDDIILGNIGMYTNVEKYVDTRKMKDYVAMAKDLKESGFTADEILDLIGKGY
jgi:hypothetical protein